MWNNSFQKTVDPYEVVHKIPYFVPSHRMKVSASSFAGDDDDDDDDDFFLGNIEEEDIYQQAENVYVDTKPAPREAETPKVSIEDTVDSASDWQSEKRRSSAIESDPSELLVPTAPDKDFGDIYGGHRNKKRSSFSSDRSTASTSEVTGPHPISPQPKTKRQKYPNAMASFLEPDENEEFFREIAKEARKTTSLTKESTPKQPQRVYNVRFLSKLDGTMNKVIQMKALGKYNFSSILPSVLSGFIKEYGIPTIMKKFYTTDNVTLYWNNAKLLNFMTCNSLKISQAFENEISDVEITVVSKEYEKRFEEDSRLKLLEEEQAAAKELLAIRGSEIPPNKDEKTSRDIEQFEKELKVSKVNNRKISGLPENKAIEYIDLEDDDDELDVIKLALVGQDNKKLYVNVRTSTTFSKLADYYKSHKQLPKKTKLRLIFDHDELDSKRTVGEEEMEAEDMIEVVIS